MLCFIPAKNTNLHSTNYFLFELDCSCSVRYMKAGFKEKGLQIRAPFLSITTAI